MIFTEELWDTEYDNCSLGQAVLWLRLTLQWFHDTGLILGPLQEESNSWRESFEPVMNQRNEMSNRF